MGEALTFFNNDWVTVKVPAGLEGQELFYASIYTLLTRKKDITPEKALIIAEAVTMKRLYPGLMYGEKLENEIKIV